MNKVISTTVLACAALVAVSATASAKDPLLGGSSPVAVVSDHDLAKVKGSGAYAAYYGYYGTYYAYYANYYGYYGYYYNANGDTGTASNYFYTAYSYANSAATDLYYAYIYAYYGY